MAAELEGSAAGIDPRAQASPPPDQSVRSPPRSAVGIAVTACLIEKTIPPGRPDSNLLNTLI